MRGLTERQQDVIAIIQRHITEHGRPPTVRFIAAALGIGSTNGVADHLRALERKGVIARDSKVSRGVRLLGSYAVPSATAVTTATPAPVATAKHGDDVERCPMCGHAIEGVQ